jgi:L-arabinose isomerase
VEVLEFDDLRQRVEKVTDRDTTNRMDLARQIFTLDDSVANDDFAWGAKVSVALDRLVDDFELDSLAYYHRGLDGEQHERLGAGMILGASLLTARGIPVTGEYELRTTVAQLVTSTIGAGGSFTEIQALNFNDNVVEMGHDGPAHLAVSSRDPLLRGLGVYHGKRGYDQSLSLVLAKTVTAPLHSLPHRGQSFRDHCCKSATPHRASTSAWTRASGLMPGALRE